VHPSVSPDLVLYDRWGAESSGSVDGGDANELRSERTNKLQAGGVRVGREGGDNHALSVVDSGEEGENNGPSHLFIRDMIMVYRPDSAGGL
jgi:hypothetical protein